MLRTAQLCPPPPPLAVRQPPPATDEEETDDNGPWVPDCEIPPLLEKKKRKKRAARTRRARKARPLLPRGSPQSRDRTRRPKRRSAKKPDVVGNTTCCVLGCSRECGFKTKRWHTSLKCGGYEFKNAPQFANLSKRRVAHICDYCYFSDHYRYRKIVRRQKLQQQAMDVD
jgi:hypothetical protein